MADPIQVDPVSRRTILKGMAGVAGLATIPGLLAACSTSSSAAPSTAASAAAPSGAASVAPSAGGSVATGSLTVGSNLSDDTPKKAFQAVVDAFTTATGIAVKINTVDHTTFQNTLSNYLQATPEDVITWFSGHRMRFFAKQGLFTPIDDVWTSVGPNFTDAMKIASTSDDTHQYLVPFDTYAWTVYYRKSLWADKGYTIPTTLADFTTLAKKMQTDGLVPIGLGDKDGWPAMGHFDIMNLRENGYDFHVGLMNGVQKWTDPKVKKVFTVWQGLLPYYQTGSPGRIWQDAAAGLVKKTTGMMLQPQVGETFAAAGPADFADLDFFPWPNHGTQWDAEKALDAPINGFMLTAKSPTLAANMDNAKAFLEFIGTGKAQIIYAQANPAGIATPKDTDTSKYTPLQKHQAQVIGDAQKLTQFLDRDARSDFAGQQGMQAFLVNFLQNPTQDLDAFLKKIQDYYDSLGPES
jgi:multiple sugar transport system substrate-binding protein